MDSKSWGVRLVACLVVSIAALIGIQWAVRTFRLHTMPHHWFILDYTQASAGRAVDGLYVDGVGPFDDKRACERYLAAHAGGSCMNMVDADLPGPISRP